MFVYYFVIPKERSDCGNPPLSLQKEIATSDQSPPRNDSQHKSIEFLFYFFFSQRKYQSLSKNKFFLLKFINPYFSARKVKFRILNRRCGTSAGKASLFTFRRVARRERYFFIVILNFEFIFLTFAPKPRKCRVAFIINN